MSIIIKSFKLCFFLVLMLLIGINLPLSKGHAQQPDNASYRHILHNWFFGNTQNQALAEHALQMNYEYIPHTKPSDSIYQNLQLIKLNSAVTVMEIHSSQDTGALSIVYFHYAERRQDDLSPLAALFGLQRKIGQRYSLSEADYNIFRNYSSRRQSSELNYSSNLTIGQLKNYFYNIFEYGSGNYRVVRFLSNFGSKKVVQDFFTIFTSDFPFDKYSGIFFDDFSLRTNAYDASYNSSYGGQGSYSSWKEGQDDLFRRAFAYYRQYAGQHADKPFPIYVNVWSLRENWRALRQYSVEGIAADHFFFEQGGLGTQTPNGVIPGTDIPAYVENGYPNHYIPAYKVSLDDVHRYCRQGTCDRQAHFHQHLDACGTAGLYGAWFGWYGGDIIDMKDNSGNLIYTNDLQLLRAIPDWDNLSRVSVPPFGQNSSSTTRQWTGSIYRSARSYASDKVIYSRHPSTGELFAVFRSLDGIIRLNNNEQVLSAYFVNDWFSKTNESALSAFNITNQQIQLKSNYQNRLGKGVRITLTSTPTPSPSSLTCFNSPSPIDGQDVKNWAINYLSSLFDTNSDGLNNVHEFGYLVSHWGQACQ